MDEFNTPIDDNAMYLTEDSFSFDMLEDDYQDYTAKKLAKDNYFEKETYDENSFDAEIDGYGDFNDDAGDLMMDELLTEDEKERYAARAAEEQQIEDDEKGKAFHNIPDNAKLTIGEHTISKADLSELVRVQSEVKEAYNMLTNFSHAMERRELENNTKVYAATLECDRHIEAIQRRMNDPMTNPSEKGNLWSQLQNMTARRDTIANEAAMYSRQMEDAKVAAIQQRYQIMNAEMSKEMTDWKVQGPRIQNYLEKSGMSMNDVHSVVSPAFARILMKAMKYDDTVAESKAAITGRLKSQQQRAIKTSARASKAQADNKQKILNMLNQGNNVDSSMMFDFLED